MKTPEQNTPQTDLRKQAEELIDNIERMPVVSSRVKDDLIDAMLEFHQSQSTTQPETLLNTERVELIEDIEDAQEKFIQLLLPEIYGEDPDCELIYDTFEDCKKFLKSLFGQPETLGKGEIAEIINEVKMLRTDYPGAQTVRESAANEVVDKVVKILVAWYDTLNKEKVCSETTRLLNLKQAVKNLHEKYAIAHGNNDYNKGQEHAYEYCLDLIKESLSQQPYGMISEGQPDSLHPDSRQMLKTCFEELRLKMIRAQEKYGYSNGWLTQYWEQECREQLYVHAQKGDPKDVAIYALFMMYRGWSTNTEDNCGFCGAKFSECGHIRMEQPESKDGKVLTFEIFTEGYSRIVQTKSIQSAISKFQSESPSDKIISVNDVSYDLLNKALSRAIRQQLEQSNEAKEGDKSIFYRLRCKKYDCVESDEQRGFNYGIEESIHELKSSIKPTESEQVDLNYESLRRNVRTISDRIGSLCALYFSPVCEDHEAVLKNITFEADRLDRLTKPSTH